MNKTIKRETEREGGGGYPLPFLRFLVSNSDYDGHYKK